MNSETKMFLGMILATIVIVIGAVFLFSKPTNEPAVNPALLVNEDSHRYGSPSASMQLVEFGDFQCPACSTYHAWVSQLLKKYQGSLLLVFRQFPLPAHTNAIPAALAAEAAGKQGKFWEMYDALYLKQKEWSESKNPKEFFLGYAQKIGLDTEQFTLDSNDDLLKKRIDRDVADGNALGVNATPTFYINNKKMSNVATFDEFEALIKDATPKAP